MALTAEAAVFRVHLPISGLSTSGAAWTLLIRMWRWWEYLFQRGLLIFRAFSSAISDAAKLFGRANLRPRALTMEALLLRQHFITLYILEKGCV